MTESFRVLFNEIPQSAVLIGSDQKIKDVNKAFKVRFENSVEKLKGESTDNLMLQPRNKSLRRSFRTLKLKSLEIDEGTVVLLKKSSAKASPKGKEYFLRTLAEHIPGNDFALVNPNLDITVAKGRAFMTYGCKRQRLEGYNLKDILRPSSMDDFLLLFNTALKGESVFDTVSDHSREYELEFVPVYDDSGDVEIVLFICRDVTIQKQALVEKNRAEKLQLTRNILRSIAHEVRNPLTNIGLACDELSEECSEIGEANMFLEIISRNTKRIDILISEIMQSTKSQGLVTERCSVHELMQGVENIISDRVKLTDIRFTSKSSCPDVAVEVDEEKLTMALGNIAINALEAVTGKNGRVALRSRISKDKVVFSITDNGVGMDKATLAKIFDPFHTGKSKGMGLGLTGALNIIKSHNAEIKVESTPGKGSVFYVFIDILEQ